MLNFPCPYPDELVYSTVARAGIRSGITSPKKLLDAVFENRHVISTIDLPNHLSSLLRLYPSVMEVTLQKLVFEHTLFPLYAPFVAKIHRDQSIEKMALSSQGAVHLMLGVSASRIKQPRYLRYCPKCIQRQLAEYGEYFWLRQWQIAGADCCLEHGYLLDTEIDRQSNRHKFIATSPSVCPILPQKPAEISAIKVTQQVYRLLQLKTNCTANYEQWSLFYKQLAEKNNCLNGRHLKYEEIKERVLSRWPVNWLAANGLAVSDKESNWLRTIFRKHRKSFSYLEHIVAMDAFLPDSWQIDEVLNEVASINLDHRVVEKPLQNEILTETNITARIEWLALINQQGIKLARKEKGALYAWLYRNDKVWLISNNRQWYDLKNRQMQRINWSQRDLETYNQLTKIREYAESLLDSPRRSRNWYLSKLEHRAMIEKSLQRMPLTALFFEQFCEGISAYQIRRLTLAIRSMQTDDISMWRLLRMTGLSEQRLTHDARNFLKGIKVNYATS